MAKKYRNVKRIYFEIGEPGDKDCIDVEFPAAMSGHIQVLNPKSFSMSNKCDGCKRGKAKTVKTPLSAMLRGAGLGGES